MEKRGLDWFYYAAPLWFLLEQFFWPNLRAGVVTGGSLAGNLAFYGAEWGIGAALFFGLRWARPAALCENAVQLVFFLKYIIFSHLDVAASLDADPEGAQAAAGAYAAALPGALWSCAQIIFRIKAELAGRGRPV